MVEHALEPARAAGRSYIESKRYVPTVDMPKYQESNEGWPLVTGGRIGSTRDGPPDWTSIFSRQVGQLSCVLVEDVPELAQSMRSTVDLAKSNRRFAEFLSFLWDIDDFERRNHYAEYEFLVIVGEILGRAEALGTTAAEDLFDLYLQIERGRTEKVLVGDIVVPLVLTTFANVEPVQFADNLWLESIDEPEQRSRALDAFHTDAVSPWVAAAATHAIVWRGATFANTAWPPRFRKGEVESPVALDIFNRVVECIHIATGKKSGYAQILVRSENWVARGWSGDLPPIWKAAAVKAYPDEMDGGWLKPKDPISKSQLLDIQTMFTSLEASPKNVRLAARRCLRSTFRTDIEDEILDATIGIEALLTKGRDELTHRMSQRASAALADEYSPIAMYNLVKQVYAQRSAIVHGSVPKNSTVTIGDATFSTSHIAVLLLRLLLRSYLLSEDPWTPDDLDSLILERLGRIPPPSA